MPGTSPARFAETRAHASLSSSEADVELGSAPGGQVLLEILAAEAQRSPDAQVWEAPVAGEIVDRRYRQAEKISDLVRREQLVVERDVRAHDAGISMADRGL
jgi:hypothetical protein